MKSVDVGVVRMRPFLKILFFVLNSNVGPHQSLSVEGEGLGQL